MTFDVQIDDKSYRLELAQVQGKWECRVDGKPIEIDAVIPRRDVMSILVNGHGPARHVTRAC